MLTVWGRRDAFNVQKVLWLIGRLGIDHRHVDAGGKFGGLDGPAFRQMNPHGRVPVIDDNGTVVWESHTILRYLATSRGAEALYPVEPGARAAVDQWLDWGLATGQRDFLDLFWGYYRTPAAERDNERVAALAQRCANNIALVDDVLGTRPFLAGASFTLADIPFGTTLYRYFGMGLSVPAPTNVTRWYDALCEQESYRTNVMIPFDHMKGRLSF